MAPAHPPYSVEIEQHIQFLFYNNFTTYYFYCWLNYLIGTIFTEGNYHPYKLCSYLFLLQNLYCIANELNDENINYSTMGHLLPFEISYHERNRPVLFLFLLKFVIFLINNIIYVKAKLNWLTVVIVLKFLWLNFL